MFDVHMRHLSRVVLQFINVPNASHVVFRGAGRLNQEQVLIVLDGNVIHFIILQENAPINTTMTEYYL